MDKEVKFTVFPYEESTNSRISNVLCSACRDSIEDGAEFKANCYGIRLLSEENMELLSAADIINELILYAKDNKSEVVEICLTLSYMCKDNPALFKSVIKTIIS